MVLKLRCGTRCDRTALRYRCETISELRCDHCVDFLEISFLAIKWSSDPDFSYRVSVPRPVHSGRTSELRRQTGRPIRIGILHGYLRSARFVSSKCNSTFDLNCLLNQTFYPPNNRRFCSLFRLTFSEPSSEFKKYF